MRSDLPGDVIAVVMAAGQGRRFGADKRHHRLEDGRTLLATTLDNVSPAYPRVYVLTRPGETSASLGIDYRNEVEVSTPTGAPAAETTRFECVEAISAMQGLGGSLGDAFRHLQAIEEPAMAAAVILGDMPWLEATLCQQLSAEAKPKAIVMPRFAGRGGHPVVFGRTFWGALATLTDGEGARDIVNRHSAARHWVDVETPSIWRDVDRRGDLD
ncbi:nucleotidyltransferase family protein [Salinicola aestuarinus]|uniref:nucleotidyltransferase family protein n=1 Tax=Salinicola aestuarinus TaxID=1949082 RepID=UPI000DA179A7|nr:nucleotidyltransferase family protein [Salinicola aestuarinus]